MGSAAAASADDEEVTTTVTAAPRVETCSPTGSPGAVQQRNLDVSGEARWYLLTAPENEASPLPLVIDFHGLAEGAEAHVGMSGFSDLAMEEGFLVALPQGTGQPVSWSVGPNVVGSGIQRDLDFVAALIDDVAAEHCVDRARIYATGLSNGAMLTSYLGCSMSGTFAAVAPVAGITTYDGCVPDRAVPVMAIHGTADPILRFNGGVGDLDSALGGRTPGGTTPEADLDGPGYPASAAAWAENNGCDPGYVDTEVSTEVVHRVWSCPDGADVEFYIVLGGGHAWPGSDFSASIDSVLGHTTFDIDATRQAWDFCRGSASVIDVLGQLLRLLFEGVHA